MTNRGEPVMLRILIEDLAELSAIGVFLAMVGTWAQAFSLI